MLNEKSVDSISVQNTRSLSSIYKENQLQASKANLRHQRYQQLPYKYTSLVKISEVLAD